MLPCFTCGKVMLNAFPHSENQPQEGTEFRTYGAYGSTFWDSFDGEELVLNICDNCLRAGTHRLAQHKRFRPVIADCAGVVGRQWVDRPMVPYTGNPDNGDVRIEPEEIGELPQVEWDDNLEDVKKWAIERANSL